MIQHDTFGKLGPRIFTTDLQITNPLPVLAGCVHAGARSLSVSLSLSLTTPAEPDAEARLSPVWGGAERTLQLMLLHRS